MNIIQKQPNPSGAYPPVQSWSGETPPDTHYEFADGIEMSCGGFGELTIEDGVVTGFTPNTEAWEQWQAEHPAPEPEPQPTAEEDRDAMLVDLEYRMTLMELGVN